nr:DUF885 domain-containing protein [uncultured Anaerostipes sp.]
MELAGSLKKIRVKLIVIGICLIFLAVLSFVKEDHKDNSDQEKFQRYTISFFKENASANEITMHYLLENPEKYGLKKSKSLYGKMKKEDVLNEKNKISDEIKKLKKFRKKELTRKQQNTYEVLMDYLSRQEKLAMYPYYERVLGKSSGQQVQILLTLSEYRLKNEQNIKSYFKLLRGLNAYFDSLIEYSKEQVKRNLFISDESLEETLKQIKSVTTQKDNMLAATFNLRISEVKGINAATKKQYCRENKKIVKMEVIPAYERLYSHLQALKGNGKNKNGLYYYKNGKDYYEALVAQKTGSAKTVEEMIEISDQTIEKCLRKLIKLQKKYPNIINRYRKSKKNIKIVQNSQKVLNKLRQKMVKYYPKAPKVSCKIKYVHKTMEEYTSPAFYMVPAIDSYKENVIYINKAQTAELYPTLAHEGYPGHLYQNVYYAARNDDPVRYLLDYPGYSEGYATYVESFSYSMMDAEGYGDIYQQMNMEMYEYNLALCSRVDLGVHYEGWKKKDVRAYLRSFGMDDSQADELFQMIIENPANYLSYYIGYQEFHELLTDYKKMAGNKYSLKAYHTEILDAGPCSFDILRRRIESNL